MDESGEYLISRKTSLILFSITAETFAELVRDNGDAMLIRFDVGGAVHVTVAGLNFYKHTNKDLGEFFLRVAKQRKYIND